MNAAGQGGVVGDLYPSSSVTFLSSGRIDNVVAPKSNIGVSEREGIDMSFKAHFETDMGDFSASLNVSKFLTYKDSYLDSGVLVVSQDRLGEEDYPDLRMNVNIGYSLGDHSVTYFAASTSAQEQDEYADESETSFYKIDAYMTHNLSYSYSTPWNSVVALGVNNMTNEEPKFKKDGSYNGSLYSPYGRTYYVSFSQSF